LFSNLQVTTGDKMNQFNNLTVSKVKDGLIILLAAAVLFLMGVSGNFIKPAGLDSIPSFQSQQFDGGQNGASLIPIGVDGGGPDGG
jgi:hypothetical protein